MKQRPAVFLDRDGVLIATQVRGGKPRAISTLAECEILPGVEQALGLLKLLDVDLIVVTNQPDVSAGLTLRDNVEAIHDHLQKWLPLDAIFVCYHQGLDNCDCRKPKPGMLLDAAREFDIDLATSVMVGDRWSDIGAGKAAGCSTVLIGSGYGESFVVEPDLGAADLLDAVPLLTDLICRSETGP